MVVCHFPLSSCSRYFHSKSWSSRSHPKGFFDTLKSKWFQTNVYRFLSGGDVVKYNRLNGPEWEGFPILWGSWPPKKKKEKKTMFDSYTENCPLEPTQLKKGINHLNHSPSIFAVPAVSFRRCVALRELEPKTIITMRLTVNLIIPPSNIGIITSPYEDPYEPISTVDGRNPAPVDMVKKNYHDFFPGF